MSDRFGKQILRKILPQRALEIGKRGMARGRLDRAERALRGAAEGPSWLDPSMIDALARRYPVTRGLEPASAPSPNREEARRTIRQCGESARTVLEVGGGPGLVSWGIAKSGRLATCIDILDEVHPGAVAAGVRPVVGDGCAMPFSDHEFDAAFSYNSFEHIHEPRAALMEMARVVRPGGRIHVAFAPIYNAPLGLHAFMEFGIPFIQHLFREDDIRPRVTSPDLWNLNHWPLARYRALWDDVEATGRLRRVAYSEERDFGGVELIAEFPSCFAKTSRDIDEFTVSKLVVTFEVA